MEHSCLPAGPFNKKQSIPWQGGGVVILICHSSEGVDENQRIPSITPYRFC